jgi:hypothetical protein
MSVQEFDVYGKTYRIGKLNAFQQFHITRRLFPVSKALGSGLDFLREQGGAKAMQEKGVNFLHLVEPLGEALARMSNEDSEYIINTALSIVQRKQGEGVWAPVQSAPGHFQFDDIELPQMLAITWRVLRQNLAGFFFELLSALRPAAEEDQSNSSPSGTAKAG